MRFTPLCSLGKKDRASLEQRLRQADYALVATGKVKPSLARKTNLAMPPDKLPAGTARKLPEADRGE